MHISLPSMIRRKRDGGRLESEEIRELIGAYTAAKVPDYQMAAMLMAVLFRGLDEEELSVWTDAMLHSGRVMSHAGVPEIKVDKHSTGGVGDKISLCLAPAVAALGVPVPMVSGRGLGHTGGTLDKLESIPGFEVNLAADRACRMLEECGLFLIGQTEDLAPADRKLYALRDVTGTVESIPLIASSIMSKKLAEGIDALVLDVKVGDGAFMRDLKQARTLAKTLIGIGEASGKSVVALITDMTAPIGLTVGNALEVREAIDVMRGGGPPDTVELTRELGARMLLLGAVVDDLDAGKEAIDRVLRDGSALELFSRVIELQGGDPDVCADPEKLPAASNRETIVARRQGYVARINPRVVAAAALEVGAGRKVKEDDVDPATGIELAVRPGDPVTAGQPLAVLHHNDSGDTEALKTLETAFEITDAPPKPASLIRDRI